MSVATNVPLATATVVPEGAETPAIKGKETWLDYRHPEYSKHVHRWKYARDHYTGEVLETINRGNYLVRKAQAESENSYLERSALADYTPHYGALLDSLAGMMFAVEDDAQRFLGTEEKPGLGELKDEDSPMHRLWRNADNHGNGWLTFFKRVAIELIMVHRVWIVVDQDEDGQAVLRLWPAESVVNWRYEGGRLAEVLLMEAIDQRKSLQGEKAQMVETYVLYDREGWSRWKREAKQETTPTKVNEGKWNTPFVNEKDRPVLPIYRIELSMPREVGWLMAKKANAIFNKESERDNLLRTANFPYLVLVGNDTQFAKMTADLARGARALQQDPTHTSTHSFIAPPTQSAQSATEVLNRKVDEFYITGFREYGDAAREKTATEVRQDVASGVGAFLQMLSDAVEDAENEALDRVAQIEFPTDKSRWFVNYVERSHTFVPSDVEQIITNLKVRYFPKDAPVPVGPSGLMSAIKQIAEYDGVVVEDDELKAAIMVNQLNELMNLFAQLPIPGPVKVTMTLDLLVALGKVDPEEATTLEDGTEMKLIDLIRQEMEKIAEADDAARKRMAQPLDFGPPPPPAKNEPDGDEPAPGGNEPTPAMN